ncbi:MAG: 6-bladed beta-propeller [Gemmatimonadetes bacterium]|nr:6-bladed beta-propeller [Gemmatimonadota bacterium]
MSRRLLACVISLIALGRPLAGQPGPSLLRLIDSVRVAESDTFLLSRPTRLVVGPRGHYFVADSRDPRLIELQANGRLVRRIGRNGAGPGELRRPASVAIAGDSLLSVWDAGNQRVVTWDLRTLDVRATFPLKGWFPQLRYDRGVLTVGVLSADASEPPLQLLAPDGTRRSSAGAIPPAFRAAPPLVGGFGIVMSADDGDDTYAVFEVENALYHWKRGLRSADVTTIPLRERRGVRPELFQEMLRNPEKAGPIAYDRSIGVALQRLAPGILGFVTVDGQLEKGTNFVGTLRLTVLDLARRRACVDMRIPALPDPLPAVAFSGDTLVVLQGGETASGDAATFITRYHVGTARCPWVTLPSATPAR